MVGESIVIFTSTSQWCRMDFTAEGGSASILMLGSRGTVAGARGLLRGLAAEGSTGVLARGLILFGRLAAGVVLSAGRLRSPRPCQTKHTEEKIGQIIEKDCMSHGPLG